MKFGFWLEIETAGVDSKMLGVHRNYYFTYNDHGNELYFFDFSKKSLEEAKAKFRPSEEDINPNMRFVENRFLVELSNNYELKKSIEYLKINWANYNDVFRNVYNSFRATEVYKNYMAVEKVDFDQDKAIVLSLEICRRNYRFSVRI